MLQVENLKKQAKQIVRWHREGYYPVAGRIRAGLPRFAEVDDAAILSRPFALRDAHELIARELGFESWEILRIVDVSSLQAGQQRREKTAELLGLTLSCLCPMLRHRVSSSRRSWASKSGFSMGNRPFMRLFKETAPVLICDTCTSLFSTET